MHWSSIDLTEESRQSDVLNRDDCLVGKGSSSLICLK
jgi:hypothetical protein